MNENAKQISLKKLPRIKPRGGLAVMYSSIRALLLRELQTRFGQYRLGYFWIFLEPLLNIGILLLIFGAIREVISPGIDFLVFLVNGIIPFFMFRTGVTQAMNAVQSNKGLFSYKPVKPIDAVIARNFLEFLLKFVTYIAFSLVLIWFGFHIDFDAIPQLLMYWGLLFLFMFACSLVFMVIADFSQEIQKVLNVLFLLLYLLSGIIYSIQIIPMPYREYLLWNPLIHIFEYMRHAVSPTYVLVPGVSLTYFVEWLIGTMFLGLLLYKRFEKRMVRSK